MLINWQINWQIAVNTRTKEWNTADVIYRVFNNDCIPFTAETSNTLAKILLYYNSLNKVTVLCKFSATDVYCLIFKKIKNYKLLIRVAASSSNNSIQPVPEWQKQFSE